MAGPLLEVIDLHHRYGGTVALEKVSFQVEEGEIFGLLGPNGAGKTTLLSAVSGLLRPRAGAVRVRGRPLQSSDLGLRRQIGIVPQELAVYTDLTARENLRFFGELYGVAGAQLDGRVGEVLAAVGLADRADERVGRFSGGMRRRLNLGCALVHRPTLLLLDEPTVGVDPQSRNHIFEEVRRLNAAGATVVYTSHYMEEVQALCPRIGIIDHGRLIRCDTLPGLLALLPGRVRLRVKDRADDLLARLGALPEGRATRTADGEVVLEGGEVKTLLLQAVRALGELHIEPEALTVEEPTLDRVFLHLTGRQLRD